MSKKPIKTRRRAAIYVRISKDKREKAGVRRQETECRELAERLGWDIVTVYVDNDQEASSGKPRPQYIAMVEAMKAGEIDAVIGWHSDRIYRRPDELEDLIKIADEHDVLFAAVQVGNIDLSTASGRLVARLLGAAAKYETELKGERQSSQLRQRAESGLPTGGGSRPFGWNDGGMTLRESESTILSDMVDRAIAGETVGALTEWLTAEGVPSVSGKPWSPTVVRRMLTRPRIAALSTWDGEIVGKAQWEPAVDEATWRRVVEVLAYRGPARQNRGRVAMLPGLIWCSECEYELVTYRQQRDPGVPSVRSYGCRTRYLPGRPGHLKSCGKISVKAEWVEDDVSERLLARLAKPAAQRRIGASKERGKMPAPEGAARELADAEGRLRTLGIDYGDGVIGRTEFIAARDRLAARIQKLQRVVGKPAIEVPTGGVAELVTWWEAASLVKRQAVLRTFIDRIEVGPHSGGRSTYDPSRMTISWA